MIFICLNFIFFHTHTHTHVPGMCSPCSTCAAAFISARLPSWQKSAALKWRGASRDNCASLRGHLKQIRGGAYYVCGGNLCAPFASPRTRLRSGATFIMQAQHSKLKIAQRVSILCWHKPNFTPPFSGSPKPPRTSYPPKQSSADLKLPET